MISGMTDLYVLCLGMLYPAYKMLQAQEQEQEQEQEQAREREFWQKYFIVFSIAYVFSEVLEMSLYIMIPFITLAQVIGVSVLVLPKTRATQSLYDNIVLQFYEKHKTTIHQKLKDNPISQLWTRYINTFRTLFFSTED